MKPGAMNDLGEIVRSEVPRAIFDEMLLDGLIEPYREDDGGVWYRITEKGRAVVEAKAQKRLH